MAGIGLALLRVQKLLMPQGYFYYGKLIEGYGEDVPFWGVAFRTSIPFIVGLVAGAVILWKYPGERPDHYGFLVGLLTSFLVIWPDIAHPELISYPYNTMKGKLYTLHVMFLCLFSVMGFLGGRFSFYLLKAMHVFFSLRIPEWIDAKAIANNLVASIFYTIGAAIGLLIFNWFRRSFFNRAQNV